MHTRDIAERLAAALDAANDDAIGKLLAPDVTYRLGDEVHRGPKAVVASYAAHHRAAVATFDRIEYESSVVAVSGDRATIEFVDRLEHAGERLVHTCRQHVTITEAGLARTIEHEDLPGEAEAVRAFCVRQGIE